VIEPAESLEELSRQLRDAVLPHLTNESARASVAAMVSLLGELVPRVRRDDSWCHDSAIELVAACRSVGGATLVDEWRSEIDTGLAGVEDCPPAEARNRALAVAEWILLRAQHPAAPSDNVLAPLRAALAKDLERQ
jgi:hypothetical protein